jgi:hypothetical protein
VAKKLSDIRKEVDEAGVRFKTYLVSAVPPSTYDLLEELSRETDVYIFSGVIRNFFLKKTGFRDLDIVLKDEIDVHHFFRDYKIVQNSFGGFKIYGRDIVIDMWFLNNTWAFKHQPLLYFDINQYLIPGTAFFNFSAIIYSFREEKFYASQKFLQFLRDKTIDLVYEPNANYSLCVINTFYYQDKYGLKVSDRLKKHVIFLYKELKTDYRTVQQKHFGSVIYSEEDIINRLEEYVKSLNNKMTQSQSDS